MKRFLPLLLVAVLIVACDKQKYALIPPGSTVLVLGDSVSYGTGAGKDEDYRLVADNLREALQELGFLK